MAHSDTLTHERIFWQIDATFDSCRQPKCCPADNTFLLQHCKLYSCTVELFSTTRKMPSLFSASAPRFPLCIETLSMPGCSLVFECRRSSILESIETRIDQFDALLSSSRRQSDYSEQHFHNTFLPFSPIPPPAPYTFSTQQGYALLKTKPMNIYNTHFSWMN